MRIRYSIRWFWHIGAVDGKCQTSQTLQLNAWLIEGES